MADATLADVDDLYGQRAMTDAEADALVQQANRLADDAYAGRLATLTQLEGDEADFKALLAAHFWTLREGEAQSENQSGGSISYNLTTGSLEDGLTETRWGRMATTYLRSNASVAVSLARRR